MGGVYRPGNCVCYFMIYFFIVSLMFCLLNMMDLENFSLLTKGFSVFDIKFLGFLVVSLIRLAGLPPTIGFAMKWSIIVGILPNYFVFLLFLVFGSLLSLYYYVCVIFS